MAKRTSAPQFTSFKGTFKYPRLNEPDTKFKADGEYSVRLIGLRADPAVDALIEKLTPVHEAAVAHAKTLLKKGKSLTINPFFAEVFDEATEEPTGEVEFNFKMAAKVTFKKGPKAGQTFERKPAIFDAKGAPMTNTPSIWGGTVGKVSFEVPFFPETEVPGYFVQSSNAVGLSLRLLAVQVIDLVSGGQRTASAFGFGEEDGYEHSNREHEQAEESAAASSDDGSADF